MKVIAARIAHESHSFSVLDTTLRDYVANELIMGDDIFRLRGTGSEMGGILAASDALGWELIPVITANASTSGPVTRVTYEALVEPILMALKSEKAYRAIVLSLHGAMYVKGLPDPEGELLARIRDIVGPDMLISVALDLHANVTDKMAACANIMTSYRTTPHTDLYETGARACTLLAQAIDENIRPRCYVARRPTLAGMDLGRTVVEGHMTRMQREARQIEKSASDVLDISLVAGYYMGDVFEAGPSVIVVSRGESEEAERIADRLMDDAYSWKDQITIKLESIDAALEKARQPAMAAGPLILADYTDGPGGGGYGDATRLMKALVDAQISDSVVGPIYDPEAAKLGVAAGVGSVATFLVGGKTDSRFGGEPVKLSGRVVAVSNGEYIRKGPFRRGTPGSLGQSFVLEVGCVRVIVCSKRMQAEEREQYRIFGIDPEQVNVIALKGVNLFRADFEPMARDIVFVEAGGIHASDLRTLPYTNVRRPIWPLDDV